MNELENLFEQHKRLCYSVNITAQNIPQNNNNNNSSTTPSPTTDSQQTTKLVEMTPTQKPNIEITTKSQSGTPTDVQDVTF